MTKTNCNNRNNFTNKDNVNRDSNKVGSKVILKFHEEEYKWGHKLYVYTSSFITGTSLIWLPCFYIFIYKKWKSIPKENKRKRYIYGILIVSFTYLFLFGKHRSVSFGEKYLKFKHWKLFSSWVRFCALEVIKDYNYNTNNTISGRSIPNDNKKNEKKIHQTTQINNNHRDTHNNENDTTSSFDFQKDQAILAFVPHGIFPFALSCSSLPIESENAFGPFRQVVATATTLLPIIRDILAWDDTVDASRPAVNNALQNGHRLGIIPGGIAEMFESYPKPLIHPNDECTIIPKGFLRMAIKHNIPVVPIYCFGLSNMFQRLHGGGSAAGIGTNISLFHLVGYYLEKLSIFFRVSLCIFFGQNGLPVPFRSKLLYIIGKPIFPPKRSIADSMNNTSDIPLNSTSSMIKISNQHQQQQVNDMHQRFCQELMRLFERYKHSYGWGEKSLRIVSK